MTLKVGPATVSADKVLRYLLNNKQVYSVAVLNNYSIHILLL